MCVYGVTMPHGIIDAMDIVAFIAPKSEVLVPMCDIAT